MNNPGVLPFSLFEKSPKPKAKLPATGRWTLLLIRKIRLDLIPSALPQLFKVYKAENWEAVLGNGLVGLQAWHVILNRSTVCVVSQKKTIIVNLPGSQSGLSVIPTLR